MSATAVDLAAAGYTAREFYAEGLANRYTGADANTFTTAAVLDGGNPYRTRVMVRYPKPSKFNGTLAVEWTNVTIGVDFEFATAEASELPPACGVRGRGRVRAAGRRRTAQDLEPSAVRRDCRWT